MLLFGTVIPPRMLSLFTASSSGSSLDANDFPIGLHPLLLSTFHTAEISWLNGLELFAHQNYDLLGQASHWLSGNCRPRQLVYLQTSSAVLLGCFIVASAIFLEFFSPHDFFCSSVLRTATYVLVIIIFDCDPVHRNIVTSCATLDWSIVRSRNSLVLSGRSFGYCFCELFLLLSISVQTSFTAQK